MAYYSNGDVDNYASWRSGRVYIRREDCEQEILANKYKIDGAIPNGYSSTLEDKYGFAIIEEFELVK
ncbi:hypothetical protein ACR77J_07270 [Tissierella praeacuta]|uniref:hypothetical protein n=1 Tax=Tissierella praeacuta TaxID=43131 RepID=UPI003DA27179